MIQHVNLTGQTSVLTYLIAFNGLLSDKSIVTEHKYFSCAFSGNDAFSMVVIDDWENRLYFMGELTVVHTDFVMIYFCEALFKCLKEASHVHSDTTSV